jgi:flagellar assembly factor FliW
MQFNTTRFGEISYTPEDILNFPHGLVGFPALNEFVLVEHKPETPFRWLQSISEPSTAFLVVDPAAFVQEYSPVISEGDAEELCIDAESSVVLFTTVSIPAGKPDDMTLNLAGPLVVNADSRTGKQVVLDDEAYTIKHRVFPTTDGKDQALAA